MKNTKPIKNKPIIKKQKKERSHSIANTKKVAVAIAKNPTGTLREIAEEAGVGKSTVDRKLGQLGQVKEDWLEELLSEDIEIVKLWTRELKRRLSDEEELKQIKATEISTITKESAARYMAFRWEITDARGWLKKPIDDYTTEELLALIK